MARIVVAHRSQRFGESLPQRRVKIGPSSEHAVIKGRRSPDFSQRALRNQMLSLQSFPERTANCAGISAAIEDRTYDVGFARAGITMFAEVAVEAQRTVFLSLEQAFLLQKIYWAFTQALAEMLEPSTLHMGRCGYNGGTAKSKRYCSRPKI